MESNLKILIAKYELTKFTEKFENEGIKSERHVKDINNDRLRSYYHMLEADKRNFEYLRDECIKISEQSEITHTKPESIVNEVGTIRTEHPSSLTPNSQPKMSLNSMEHIPNYFQDQIQNMGHQPEALPSLHVQPGYYRPHPSTFQHRYPNPLEDQPQPMVNLGQPMPTNYVQHPHIVPQGQYPTPYQQPFTYQPRYVYQQPSELPCKIPPPYCINHDRIRPQQFPYAWHHPERDSLPTTPSTNPSLISTHYSVNYSNGLGIIFTNESFDRNPEWKRDGARQDEENFKDIYQMMGLECKPFFDFTTEQIIQTLEGIVEEEGLAKYPMLCIGFSTHGGQGDVLFGKDGTKFSLYNQVVSLFKPDKCPNLSGRPKVFLVQACRGESREGGIRADSIEAHIPHTLESDFLIAHSTVSGHQAYRHVNTGSWFISQLKNAILTHRKKYNFLDILTFVNQFIVNTSTQNKEYSQTCQIESTLTRILKIDPKQATP